MATMAQYTYHDQPNPDERFLAHLGLKMELLVQTFILNFVKDHFIY